MFGAASGLRIQDNVERSSILQVSINSVSRQLCIGLKSRESHGYGTQSQPHHTCCKIGNDFVPIFFRTRCKVETQTWSPSWEQLRLRRPFWLTTDQTVQCTLQPVFVAFPEFLLLLTVIFPTVIVWCILFMAVSKSSFNHLEFIYEGYILL